MNRLTSVGLLLIVNQLIKVDSLHIHEKSQEDERRRLGFNRQREHGRPFTFNGVFYTSSDEFGATGKACMTQDLTFDQRKKVDEQVDLFIKEKYGSFGLRQLLDQEIVVKTYIHVVYKNSESDPTNVSEQKIHKQMKILNDAFKGLTLDYTVCQSDTSTGVSSPFRFELVGITRTLNDQWHTGRKDPAMVGNLRRGSCSDLNVFVNSARGEIT